MSPFAAGTVLGEYVVDGVLGQGAMAIVYRVRHAEMGTIHAMKVPIHHNRQLRARALREARLQGAVQHPNVVNVTDIVDINGAPGLVMDYIEGWSLEEHIVRNRLQPDEIDQFATAILAALATAHHRGIIHRDLKPSNVMLEKVGNTLVPRVADFGLVKDLEDEEEDGSSTRPNTPMGTPQYMAPEQIFDAKAADTRADVFSLGAMLYELVTGRKAFTGTTISDVYDAVSIGDYQPLGDEVPERWRTAITKSLAGNRDNRPANAGELYELWTGNPAPKATPRPSPTPRPAPTLRPPNSPSATPRPSTAPPRTPAPAVRRMQRKKWEPSTAAAFALGFGTVALVCLPAAFCLLGWVAWAAAPMSSMDALPPTTAAVELSGH